VRCLGNLAELTAYMELRGSEGGEVIDAQFTACQRQQRGRAPPSSVCPIVCVSHCLCVPFSVCVSQGADLAVRLASELQPHAVVAITAGAAL
jgi:hypothetical protein